MLIKKKVSSVFQLVATLATLAVIVALGSTSPAAAEGVTTWDDLVAKADTFTSGSHDLTVTGNLRWILGVVATVGGFRQAV